MNHGRSPTELIVKSAAIHFACLVAVAHLGSLRRLPIRVQIYECVGFILVPLLPCAQILVGMSQAVQKYRFRRDRNPFGLKYHVCAALDMYVVPDEEGEAAFPLLTIDPGRRLAEDALACESKEPSKTRWLMRMIPLVLFIGEASWGSFLWVRRIRFSQYNAATFPTLFCEGHRCYILPYADSFLDHLNAAAVIGGLGTAIASLIIHGLNCSWTCSRRMAAEVTGHNQDIATLRITGESLSRFLRAHIHEVLLACVLQIAIEYRVVNLVGVQFFKWTFRETSTGDSWALWLFIQIPTCLFYVLHPLVMFAMAIVFLFSVPLPRGLRKLFERGVESYLYFGAITIGYRAIFIFAAIDRFSDLVNCLPGGNGSCRAPFLLWADPLSHKFLTVG